MQTLLCLPHSKVVVETDISNIKMKKRNHLQLKTLWAILQVKQGIREAGGCTRFSPPLGTRKLMSLHSLYNNLSEPDNE